LVVAVVSAFTSALVRHDGQSLPAPIPIGNLLLDCHEHEATSCTDYRIKGPVGMRAVTASRAKHFPIGELSRLTGVNIETIRYYERIGMLPPPPRTASGRRAYESRDLRILAFIRRSRELGFSLDEIRTLLRLGGPEKASCREVRAIATHHLEDIRAKLADLRKLERLLTRTVARCSGKTAPDCPVLDILDIRRPK
jgi:MerR family transcriptional regulator, mercuric resistance operon regulatory protein